MDILLTSGTNSTVRSAVELIGVLLIFVFVLVITWLTTKWMGNYQKAHTITKNLNLIETIRVGNNKTVSLLKAGKKYYVISTGKDDVRVIGEMTEDDLEDFSFRETSDVTKKESFTEILSKFKSLTPKK